MSAWGPHYILQSSASGEGIIKVGVVSRNSEFEVIQSEYINLPAMIYLWDLTLVFGHVLIRWDRKRGAQIPCALVKNLPFLAQLSISKDLPYKTVYSSQKIGKSWACVWRFRMSTMWLVKQIYEGRYQYGTPGILIILPEHPDIKSTNG